MLPWRSPGEEEFPEPGRSSCIAEHPPSALGWPGAAAGLAGAAEMPGLPLIPAVLIPAAHLRDGDESPDRWGGGGGLAGGSWKAACAALPCGFHRIRLRPEVTGKPFLLGGEKGRSCSLFWADLPAPDQGIPVALWGGERSQSQLLRGWELGVF